MQMIRWMIPMVLAFWSVSATAQVKPKIMIIFDTSGSMLRTSTAGVYAGPCRTSGDMCDPGLVPAIVPTLPPICDCRTADLIIGDDGSEMCPGAGTSTRIYQLKQALFDVLLGIGANEVDWALSTFPQALDVTRVPQCPKNCGEVNPTQNIYPCAGHYYTNPATVSEEHFQYYGCKVSTHTPATEVNANCGDPTNPCAPWYDGFTKEVLRVPFGSTPEDVLIYFDQKEDMVQLPAGSALSNPEVRAAFSWFTPLGKSLFYAHGYFHNGHIIPDTVPPDPRKKCERLAVVLITDGAETCNDQETNAFYPTKWSKNLADLGVVTHTVGIDIPANDEDLLEKIATEGGGSSIFVAGDSTALKQAVLDILAASQPPSEICNGEDDDCDELVDEDFPMLGQTCNNGLLGVCLKLGEYVCKADGSGVECNAPFAVGVDEICNGQDDNCNGEVDEEIPGGCIPPICSPEICNNIDDDCDGVVDNNIPSVPCGKDVGECKSGMTACIDGQLQCVGSTGPFDEECNGLDDDCDGVVDGMIRPCYPFDSGCDLETGECEGICRIGAEICTDAVWESCEGAVGPEPIEICDGVDNNCDGNIDENAICPGESVCINGQCTQACTSGEFGCPVGQLCTNGWCVPDPCNWAECTAKGPSWLCKGGECIDACVGVICDEGTTCFRGQCMDKSCYSEGCPPGQRCVEGTCVADSCAGVTCPDGEFCLDGRCIRSCDNVFCDPGETCKLIQVGSVMETKCVADSCADVSCAAGKTCVNGKCVNDPCQGVFCERGLVCQDGLCVKDLCERTSCPAGYYCQLGECLLANVVGTSEILASGGGGFSCAVNKKHSRAPSSLFILLALGLLALTRRNRKRS